jgi:hypothetical protein
MTLKNEDAVSSVLGTILLLIIAIGLFSILFTVVNGLEPINKGPSSHILAYSKDNQIIIEHFGGESIDIRSKLFIVRNNIELSEEIGDFMDENSKVDGYWNIGEQIIYNLTRNRYNMYFERSFNSNDICFSILDYFENNIIVIGNIKY